MREIEWWFVVLVVGNDGSRFLVERWAKIVCTSGGGLQHKCGSNVLYWFV